MMFELWDELKEKMLPRFQTRKSRCEEDDMLQGIVSMIAMFYWIKGESVQTFEWEHIKQETFPVAPINWTERLEFILLKPTQYHCFIQLDELYTELKKKYGKNEALKKNQTAALKKKALAIGGKCFFHYSSSFREVAFDCELEL
ncbi:hypothetical protein BsIDN1_38820 [Bacillus safensis]|uniref:YpoC-like domain-containing protein n=1 Tax=Bacillus safensis TaxID=561879 RepID=A0A5S9MDS6_BACIA|nr:hypothetical protein BsIDN1_38820 [Bacillus safensis]